VAIGAFYNRLVRTAWLAIAIASLALTAACSGEPPPPERLVFVGYDGYAEPSTDHVALSIDVAQNRVVLTQDGQPAFAATLTADAHAQLDVAVAQVEATWDPAEPCEACRLYPDRFHIDSDQGPVSAEYGFVEDSTNVDQLRTVVAELVTELRACAGGNLIEQCAQQP
jgi:hypothetical protein